MSDQEIRFRIVVEDAGTAAADKVDRSLAGLGLTADASGRKIDGMGRSVSEMFRDAGGQAAAGQRLLQVLADQVNQAGMSSAEYQRYQAALLGVGRQAEELIGQLDRLQAEKLQDARATAERTAAERAAAAAERQAASNREAFLKQLREQVELQGKTTAEVLEYRAAQLGVSREAAPFIASLKGQGDQFTRLGTSAGQYTAAMRMLPAQLSDVATQLAGGASPLLVLTQQGLQTRDMFGSFSAAGQGLMSVLTPMRVALGGAAAVVGVLGLAAYQGYKQVDTLTLALAANGNAAGVTRGQLDAMAQSMAALPGGAIGPARDALAKLAASGEFVGGNLELAGRAAQALGRLTGQSADEAVKAFDGMRSGVAQWAATANKSYNFLTGETYRLIRSLEAQGKTQEAVTVALRALASTAESRAAPAIGYVQQALEIAKGAASAFWDSLMGWGRPETLEQQLQSVGKKIADAEASLQLRARGGKRVSTQQAEIDAMREQQRNLQEQLRLERRTAEQRGATAAKNQRDIEESSSSHVSRMLAIDQAKDEKARAIFRAATEAQQRSLEERYRQQLISTTQFAEEQRALLLSQANDEIKAAEAAEARAKKQSVGTREEAASRDAAVIQARIKVIEAKAKLQLLEADIAAGKYDPKPRDVVDSPAAAFRMLERQQTAAVEAGWLERISKAREGASELLGVNKELSLSLIQDDRARALAQLQMEEAAMRRRFDPSVLRDREKQLRAELETERTIMGERIQLSAEERARITEELEATVADRRQLDEAYAQWRVLREQQITDQLKPQWQRQAEFWADTTRYMRQAYDEFLDGFVDRGRSAFDEFLRTGKVSTSTLTAFIRQEFAKMAYERFLASSVRQIGSWIFDTLLGSGVSAGSGAPDGVPTRGGAAFGGSLAPQSAWVVGERGPEVLVMGRSGGVVVPNHALSASAGGAAPVINQYFSVKGNEDTSTLHALAAMARESALSAVADARRRGNPAFS